MSHKEIKVIPSDLYALLHSCVEYTYEQFQNGVVIIKIDGSEVVPNDFERILKLTEIYVR